MDDVKWLALLLFLLSCVVTYIWCLLDKVSSDLSDEKKKVKVLKRDQLTLDESVGDFKLDTEKGFIHARDKILELEKEISEMNTKWDQAKEALESIGVWGASALDRLDKLEAIDIKILEKNFSDFKLHAETVFKNLWRKVHVSGDLEGLCINRLDKLEGVKAPVKKTKKTKRKKS